MKIVDSMRLLLAQQESQSALPDTLNQAFFMVFAALALSGLFLFIRALANRHFGRSFIPVRQVSSPLGFFDLALLFISWTIGQLIAMELFAAPPQVEGVELTPAAKAEQFTRLSLGLAAFQFLFTLLPLAWFGWRYRSWQAIGLQPNKLGTDIVLSVAWFLMVVPPILVIQWGLSQLVEYQHETLDLLRQNPRPLTILACWSGAVFVAPVVEEFFFRVLLQGWLQRVNSKSVAEDRILLGGWDSAATPAVAQPPLWPIVVSSLVFAGMHFSQGLAAIPLFLFGLVLGFLYRQTGSVVVCIGLHFLLNAFSMFWFTLSVLYGETG